MRKSSAPGTRQRSCPGQVVSSKKSIFWKKFSPRQRSCPGQVASSKKIDFLGSSAPGSEAAWDKWLLQKTSTFWNKNLLQAAKLPRKRGCFKKESRFSGKSSAPGSEAARDKWLLQKQRLIFWKQICPRQQSWPGQVVSSKKSIFWKKVLPLAAQLPQTSGSVARKRTTAAAKGVERLLGGPGGGAPWKTGRCGGAQPPRI